MDTLPPTHVFTDTLKHVPTDRLYPNPWQTRLQTDPAHIASLAEDIRANGLLQPPLARPDPANHGYYELAFGHSRFAAYMQLAAAGHQEFDAFPVHVRPLTDRQMADLAAAENARRKDLSAIETARALQARIDAFHLTQAEAGQAFGLSQSAVANLLRLLKLPQGVQDLVHSGELPERQARKLVSLAAVDEKAVDAAAAKLATVAPDKADEFIEDQAEAILREKGLKLDNAPWDPNAPLGDLPACRGCQSCVKVSSRWDDGDTWCINAECYGQKRTLGLQAELARTAERTHIPAAADGEQAAAVWTQFNYNTDELARPLLNLKKADKLALGLRWIVAEENSYMAKRLFGSAYVTLATVNESAVKAWLKARAKGEEPESPAKIEKAKEDPAQAAKLAEAQREQEEREKDARRAERAAKLRLEADLTWLLCRAAEWIGDGLTIGEGTLDYVLSRTHPNWTYVAGLPGVYEHHKGLEAQAEAGDYDAPRRVLALRWLVDAMGNDIVRANDPWGDAIDAVRALADAGNKLRPALGIYPPDGWNEPPIHHTTYNCWQCGTFAPHSGNLNGADLSRGWLDGGKAGVFCSADCQVAHDAAKKPAPKKPTAKRGGRKAAVK